jgi:cystathionine beta-lyase
LAEGELASFGITHTYYDAMDPHDLEAKIQAHTKLVWLEAPGSVSMEFPDLVGLVQVCKSRRVLTALDNTWGAGLAFRPFDLLGDGSLSVDFTAHALTKYPSGGGDVLMGSVMTCDDALALKLKMTMMRLGICVGPNDIENILRSLPTIALRYAAQDRSARQLASWWKTQKACVQVLHPALEGSPGHAHWQASCAPQGKEGQAAGLFSVMLHPALSQSQVDAFCDNLKLFKLGYSWGGPISLVVPYNIASMRSHLPLHLQQGFLVRFSTGFEEPQDLIKDLAIAANQCLNF